MNPKDNYNVESALKKLANSGMLPYNKRKVLEYFEEKVAQGVKRTSYPHVIRILVRLGEAFSKKKFEAISKTEMVSFFNNLKPEDRILKTPYGAVIKIPIEAYSENTLWQMKAAVKTFYRWLFDKESGTITTMGDNNLKEKECKVEIQDKNGNIIETLKEECQQIGTENVKKNQYLGKVVWWMTIIP